MSTHRDTLNLDRPSLTADELHRVRWAGWAILGTVLIGWAGWLSLLSIGTRSDLDTVTERVEQHYGHLHEQVTEIRTDVKTLLRRDDVARHAP